jgi:hypothetical protein
MTSEKATYLAPHLSQMVMPVVSLAGTDLALSHLLRQVSKDGRLLLLDETGAVLTLMEVLEGLGAYYSAGFVASSE